MLCGFHRGAVCHPSAVLAKIFETQASESHHLWENHEMMRLFASALVQGPLGKSRGTHLTGVWALGRRGCFLVDMVDPTLDD